MFYNLRSALR